jgi:diaminopimelate epimerase
MNQHVFYKYQGTGNDFIIMDNREGKIALTTEQVKHLCDRKFGIGADGLMLLNTKQGYDFEMEYYNSDGNESTMCGNGGRCLVKFAHALNIGDTTYRFSAVDGDHTASIEQNGWVSLQMKNVVETEPYDNAFLVDTGSPHYVKEVDDVKNVDVFKEGKTIRNSSKFKAHGINVNFVENRNNILYVRTYERGVEDETLSCGTGVTAAALVFAHNDNGFNRLNIQTPGGNLAVEFDKSEDGGFTNICLSGPAEFVFKGEIKI